MQFYQSISALEVLSHLWVVPLVSENLCCTQLQASYDSISEQSRGQAITDLVFCFMSYSVSACPYNLLNSFLISVHKHHQSLGEHFIDFFESGVGSFSFLTITKHSEVQHTPWPCCKRGKPGLSSVTNKCYTFSQD